MCRYQLKIFLLLIGSYLIAQEPIILDEGLSRALPDFQEQWSIPIEGEVMDIEIPKEGEAFFAITEDSAYYRLYKVTLSGRLKWTRNQKKKEFDGAISGLYSSSSGNLVCINHSGYEVGITSVYSGHGEHLFDKNKTLFPSPSGNYLILQRDNDYTKLKLYDISGDPIYINNDLFVNEEHTQFKFVNNDNLLVYKDKSEDETSSLSLVKIPEGKVSWTLDFSDKLWLIDFNRRNCAYTSDYIALQGTRRPANLIILDYDGNIILEKEDLHSNHAISFSSNGNYILTVDKGQWVKAYDLFNGKQVFDIWVDKYSLTKYPELDYFNSTILISNARAMNEIKIKFTTQPGVFAKHFSYIIELNQDKEKDSFYAVNEVCATKYSVKRTEVFLINANNNIHMISGRTKNVEQ